MPRLDGRQLGLGDEVGLVEHDLVGEGDLLDRLAAVVQAQEDVLGVDHGGDGVELGLGPQESVDEEGLRHRAGIGEAGGLDHDGVECRPCSSGPCSVRIRSPRTVQQMQPLFISNSSSSVSTMRSLSMPISPNSLTITA